MNYAIGVIFLFDHFPKNYYLKIVPKCAFSDKVKGRFLIHTFVERSLDEGAELAHLFVVESVMLRLAVWILWAIGVGQVVGHLELDQVAEVFIGRCWEFLLNHLFEIFVFVIHFAEMMQLRIIVRISDLDAVSSGAECVGFLWELTHILIHRSGPQCAISEILLGLELLAVVLPVANGRTQLAVRGRLRNLPIIISCLFHFGVIFERNGVVAGFGIKVHRVLMRPTDSGLRGGFVSWGARSGPRIVVGQLRATE